MQLSRTLTPYLNINDDCPRLVADGLAVALVSPDLAVMSVVGADVWAARIAEKRREAAFIPLFAFESLRRTMLYFTLVRPLPEYAHMLQDIEGGHHLEKGTVEDADRMSRLTVGSFGTKDSPEAVRDEELWQTLDEIVNRIRGQSFAQDMSHLQGRAPDGGGDYDALWRIFWEHYRGDSSKATLPEVASVRACTGGRLTTQGCLPSLSERILQEFDCFEKHDRSQEAKNRLAPPQTPSTPSNACSPVGTPPSAKGSRRPRSGANSFSSRGHPEGAGYEKWGFGQDPSLVGAGSNLDIVPENHEKHEIKPPSAQSGRPSSKAHDNHHNHHYRRQALRSAAKRLAQQTSAMTLRLPMLPEGKSLPIKSFKSWEDYKVRSQVNNHEKFDVDSKKLNDMAASRPQGQNSIALREHQRACEWQIRAQVVHPSGAMTARGGFFQLPEVVATRSGGFLSARNNTCVPSTSFHRPWSREDGMLRKLTNSKKHLSAIERFAKVCANTGVHPQPASIRFLVTLPPKLDVRGAGYADEDVLALAAALPPGSVGRIEVADLGESPRLTDKAVCRMLQALAERHSTTMNIIRLDRCRCLRKDTIELCTRLIKASFKDLQMLDLSGISIGHQEYVELARAATRHAKLREIRLAETGLGTFDKAHAARVIELLVSNQHLEAVELGWNSLDVLSFETLGRGLVTHKKLNSVGLANTGPTRNEIVNGSPVLVFLEFLAKDKTLTNLDISNNVLSPDAMLVLESAAQRHHRLARIDVSRNPVGLNGARALLRLMAHEQCPDLTKILIQECSCGWKQDSNVGPWDADPSGKYSLDLTTPVHRALFKLLLMRLCDGPDALPPNKLMSNVRFRRDGVEIPFNFKSLRQCSHGTWEFPIDGILDFDLNASESVCGIAAGSEDATMVNVTSKVEDMISRSRLSLKTARQEFAVLGQVKSVTNVEERCNLLEALSYDFILTPEQVNGLCKTKTKWSNCGKEPSEVFRRLLACIHSPQHHRTLFRSIHGLVDLTHVGTCGRWLLSLNLTNPTGHYDLNLSEASDRSVAERLLLLNRWEVQMWRACGRPDISQHGNWKNFRNGLYGNREFIWSAEEWRLPGSEPLSFDFVSLRRPPHGAKPLDDAVWNAIVNQICSTMLNYSASGTTPVDLDTELNSFLDTEGGEYHSDAVDEEDVMRRRVLSTSSLDAPSIRRRDRKGSMFVRKQEAIQAVAVSDQDVLWALRSLSSQVWLDCRQIRSLICHLFRSEARVDATICLLMRCVDWAANSKICRCKFNAKDWQGFVRKAGFINTFPFFQPENFPIRLDLAVNEQRRALNLYISLAQQEVPNRIVNSRINWSGPSTSPNWDTFVAGIPLSWEQFENISSRGFFEGVYQGSADSMKLRVRRKLASSVGGWIGFPDDNAELQKYVKWWCVLDDLPEDVIVWANFCVAHFPSPSALFQACDSSKDGTLNFKEFQQGFQTLGFRLQEPEEENKMTKKKTARSILTKNLRPGSGANSKRNSGAESPEPSADVPDRAKLRKSAVKMRTESTFEKVTSMASSYQKKVNEQETKQLAVLTSVYRFLDPNGDGEVSQKEFNVLAGIWNELQHTTWEFVQHLKARIGSLTRAWELADEDGSDSMDFFEFQELARRWNFDGPVSQIYMFLDEDGSNSIGKSEWMTLEKVSPAM